MMSKLKISKIMIIMLGMTMMVLLVNCGNDDGAKIKELMIETLMVGASDLNGVSSPNDVTTDAKIVITFNTEIDPATANATNIKLVRTLDDAEITTAIAVSGKSVTITPELLTAGTSYEFTMSAGVASTGGLFLTAITRSFTTDGSFIPEGIVAQWDFEDNADDAVGNYNPSANGVVDITYADSRSAKAGKAAVFNGNTSIIEIPGADALMNTDVFTLSFWVKAEDADHVNENGDPTGHFVLGLGAFYGFQFEIGGGYDFCKIPAMMEFANGATGTGGDLFWNGDGVTKDNDGWQGTTLNHSANVSAIFKNSWAHVVYVFNGSTKTRSLYVNGKARLIQDLNLWPADSPERTAIGLKYGGAEPDVVNELAFGFVQSRAGTLWDAEPWGGYDITTSQHLKGKLDGVKVFHNALTAPEVELMYNTEK